MGLSRFAVCWLNGGFTPDTLDTTPVPFVTWSHTQDGPGMDASLDGKLTVKVPGYYWAACSLSFNADAGVIYYMQIRENGAANDYVNSVEGIASGGRVTLTTFVGGRPAANDVIEVYMWSNAPAGAAFTPVSGQFFAISI